MTPAGMTRVSPVFRAAIAVFRPAVSSPPVQAAYWVTGIFTAAAAAVPAAATVPSAMAMVRPATAASLPNRAPGAGSGDLGAGGGNSCAAFMMFSIPM